MKSFTITREEALKLGPDLIPFVISKKIELGIDVASRLKRCDDFDTDIITFYEEKPRPGE
jgi:hypothetical protein